MTPPLDLSKLTIAEKDALILSLLSLIGQLKAALARIGELEARLAKLEAPPKTPDNSSLPSAKGQKTNGPAASPKLPRKAYSGTPRMLEPNLGRVVNARLDACPRCDAAFAEKQQAPMQVYDRVEITATKPDVTRVRLFGGRCACCGERAVASVPVGLEPGSPFGKSTKALVIYLHYTQAIGLERLRLMLAEIFGLSISKGALRNILARASAPLSTAASANAA